MKVRNRKSQEKISHLETSVDGYHLTLRSIKLFLVHGPCYWSDHQRLYLLQENLDGKILSLKIHPTVCDPPSRNGPLQNAFVQLKLFNQP